MYEELNPYVIFTSKKVISPNILCYKKRTVKWFEIEFITTGGGYIETNGKRIETNPGTIFFRAPGMVVQGYLPYTGYLVVFDMVYDKINPLIYEDNDYKGYENDINSTKESINYFIDFPTHLNNLKVEKYEQLFNKLYENFAINGKENQLILKAILFQIIADLLHDYRYSIVRDDVKSKALRYYSLINDVKKYINEHICERLSLDKLASMVNLSPSFLSRIFKNTMGISLFEYINNKKIDNIKKLLVDNDMSITQICEIYDYTESFFYRLFKNKVGKTPKEYRDEYLAIKETYI